MSPTSRLWTARIDFTFPGIVDPETHVYPDPEQLREQASQAGALGSERVITYCGGGIAASSDALALTLLGVEKVALYEGSLTEWAADPTMPLVTGKGRKKDGSFHRLCLL